MDFHGVDNNNPLGQELAYDLRQIYAKLVGEHLEDIALARKNDNYYMWYKNLLDLHTIVEFKFKAKKDKEEEFIKINDAVILLANKFIQVWLGTVKKSDESFLIEEALRKMERFLYERMNDASMFGSSRRIEGL